MVEVMKKVSENYVENVKKVRKNFPKALVFDVTVDGALKKFDLSFPVEKVEIPGMNRRGLSFECVWEGLKVFEKKEEIDLKWMNDERKIGKVRGCKSWGKLKGIKIGNDIVSEEEGKEIFKKMYVDFVKDRYGMVIDGIKKVSENKMVVLLDYKEEKNRIFNNVDVLKELIVG